MKDEIEGKTQNVSAMAFGSRYVRPRGRVARFWLLVLSMFVAMATAPATHGQEPPSRPRVGLALGGGAARGIAHIGVLEWLEEHRITVDAIAGTSMGGLVGGSYASGRSAAEVRTMVADIDWDRLFRGDVEFAQKSFRRKEDRRAYPVRVEFGLRGGLRMMQSLDPGHEVELLLSRVALPYANRLNFDDLPIPFRAVATDLEAATVEVLGTGSLASALRATMAIPGVFQPVQRDSLLLADGGLLDNVPADVVRGMGVDVVIAVDVGAPLATREEMRSFVSLAGQALEIMMAERTRSVLREHADHVVTPPLKGISLIDWRQFDTIRAIGYQAIEAAGESLAYLSLSPVAWERHIEARRARRAPSLVEPQFVRVEGVDKPAAEEITQGVEPLLGTELDPDALDLRLNRLAGRGRYGSLGYEVAQEGGLTGLGIRASEKPHGPPFLNLALETENLAEGWAVSVGTRLTVMDAGHRDAEFRFDLKVGPDVGALLDYYLPVLGSRVFISPRVRLDSRRQRVAIEGDAPGRYRSRQALAGADLGVALGSASEFRFGYQVAMLGARVESGAPLLRDIDGVAHGPRAKWVYDGHDDWLVPRSGLRIATEAQWLVTAPGQPSGFVHAQMSCSAFLPIGRRGRVFVVLGGSTALDDHLAPFYQSGLGGPLRLGAFERDQFRGVRTAHVGTGYLHQVWRMPDLIGGPVYAGAWLESGWLASGKTLPRASHANLGPNVSAGLMVDTPLGALFASVSVGNDRARFYGAIGRPIW